MPGKSLTKLFNKNVASGFFLYACCLLTINLVPAAIAASADHSDLAVAPESELESALQGLLNYALPSGWRVQFSLREHLELIRGGMQGPVLTVGTGQVERDMAGLTNRVIDRSALLGGDFSESEGEILGQPARIFEGDSDWVSGWVSRVYVLEQCAPGQSPIVFHAAMRSEEQSAHIDEMLANMRLNLPEGMTPCPEAMGPGAIWSRDGRMAIGGIEGMEGRATMREVSMRPSDRDQSYPNLRLSVDHPNTFNTSFQVGNRFGHGFAKPPIVTEAKVAGHDALAFTGRGEAGERHWDLHVYLLQTCLPDGAPIIVTRRRAIDDPLADDLPDPMLEHVFLELPPETAPCKPDLIDDALERVEATRPIPTAAERRAEPTVSDKASDTALPQDPSNHDPVTVRALGAFGLLPEQFMPTAQVLRDQGKDLLAADLETLQDWLNKARQSQLQLGTAERLMLEKIVSLLTEFQLSDHVSPESPPTSADVSDEKQGLAINAKRIAGGYDHTLILDEHGQAWATGNNRHGQLGDGRDPGRSSTQCSDHGRAEKQAKPVLLWRGDRYA